MFHIEYPIFEKGRLLKIEMLESLRDYPRDIMEISMRGYENGIWKGCEVLGRGKKLVIKPGILHHEGQIYILNREYEFSYKNSNRLTFLKAAPADMDSMVDFKMGRADIVLSEEECKENEIELCRFTLQEGFELRNEYTSFADFNTKYDTIITLHAPYLHNGEITINPQIMIRFAEELLECSKDSEDFMFAMLILNNEGSIAKEVMKRYFIRKEINCQELHKNEEYYIQLLKRLEQSTTSLSHPSYERKERRILV